MSSRQYWFHPSVSSSNFTDTAVNVLPNIQIPCRVMSQYAQVSMHDFATLQYIFKKKPPYEVSQGSFVKASGYI